MLSKIIMPPGGQTTNESVLTRWHKQVGEAVKKGDVLFEIETDKATLPVESFADGILLAAFYREGDSISTGEVVCYVGNEGDKLPETEKTAEEDEYQPIMRKAEGEWPAKTPEQKERVSPVPSMAETSDVLTASPAARYTARQEKVSLKEVVHFTGRQPVKQQDVLEYLKRPKAAQEADVVYIETSGMRRTIARRMTESVTVAPHFTASVDVDMSQAIELRSLLNEYLKETGVKIAFHDILMKCAAAAIVKYPMINGVYGEERIKVYRNVHFGLAVGLEAGLVVPVVRNVDGKSISAIASESAHLVSEAKNGKLQPAEMSGGTITLSNLGMFGIDRFTAILNQPESCILAVGRIGEKAVSVNGQIVSRQMMTVTASFDHRIIDGAYGGGFLQEMKKLLENPRLLLA